MAKFTTRVELHDADDEEYYEILHTAMENEGFLRTITNENKETYHLPTAEYNKEGDFTIQQILDSAKIAATKTGLKFSVLVTKSNGRKWYGLKKVK